MDDETLSNSIAKERNVQSDRMQPEAMGYLYLYAQTDMLEPDNNRVENSIRLVAIGRKNYLFAGIHDAAQRGAMMYSLHGTCKAHGIEPYA